MSSRNVATLSFYWLVWYLSHIGRLLGLVFGARAAPLSRNYPWEIFQKAYE